MSLRVPLAVRLSTARMDRHITRDLRDLTYRSNVHGFESAQLFLDRPLAYDAPEVQPFSRVYISDGRHGGTVWEGHQDDPGKGASSAGQVWSLTASGPQARAHDRTTPLIYVEQQLSEWEQSGNEAARVSDVHDGTTGLYVRQHHWPRGTVCNVGFLTDSKYFGISSIATAGTSIKLAAVLFGWDGGKTDSNWRMQCYVGDHQAYDSGLTTAGVTNGWLSYSTHFPTDGSPGGGLEAWAVTMRLSRITSSQTVADEVTWGRWGTGGRALTIRMLLFNKAGAEVTTGYDNVPYVLASEVVADLLGRLLPTFDGANAVIDPTSFQIGQLSYPSGVDAAAVLDDLMALEIGYNWSVWESIPLAANPKNRFVWGLWPGNVRYEASVVDGYDGASQSTDLYNAVQVLWTDQRGRPRTTRRTSTVPMLTDAGITREGVLELAARAGNAANATQAGDNFLADHAVIPSSGTLTVARPILDRDTGRMVMPWEIRPGYLIRVNGLAAKPNALTATSTDGASVFRVAAMEYSTSSAAAVLELDTYPRSVAQMLARFAKVRQRWR